MFYVLAIQWHLPTRCKSGWSHILNIVNLTTKDGFRGSRLTLASSNDYNTKHPHESRYFLKEAPLINLSILFLSSTEGFSYSPFLTFLNPLFSHS